MDRILENIRQLMEKSKAHQGDQMAVDSRGDQDVEASLDATIQGLQTQIAIASQELERIRAENMSLPSAADLEEPRTRLRELQAVDAGMKSFASKPPILPSKECSALPALLAYETVMNSISESKREISSLQSQIQHHERELQNAKATETDHLELNSALQARIERLRAASQSASNKDMWQVAEERIQAGRALEKQLLSRTASLKATFLEFVEEHLAVLLAAEELGGPVVGDSLDVDEESLATGVFGKKKSQPPGKKAEEKRQQRLEEIWGINPKTTEEEEISEKSLAKEEFIALVEALVDALEGNREDGVYVRLPRESAAARFLIRSRVAQLHPKDARRIRLVDFGRELDD